MEGKKSVEKTAVEKTAVEKTAVKKRPDLTESNEIDFGHRTFQLEVMDSPKDLEGKNREDIRQIINDLEESHKYNHGKFIIQEASINHLIKLYNESIIEHMELATCHIDRGYKIGLSKAHTPYPPPSPIKLGDAFWQEGRPPSGPRRHTAAARAITPTERVGSLF